MRAQGPRALRTALAGLVVGGMLVAGQAAGSPARAATTVVSTPTPSDGTDGRVNAVTHVGDRIFVGGAFTSAGGQPRSGLAALDAVGGHVITTWRADVNGAVDALAASSDGTTLYVGGDFTVVGGLTRRHLAAVSTSTGAVSGWNPGAIGGSVLALVATGGRVYAGGKLTSIGSTWRPYLAAVTSAGGLDPGFDAQMDDVVLSLALSPDTARIYAGGQFHNAGGAPRAHLAALNPTGGAAFAWRAAVSCPVLGLAATSSAVYLGCGGGFPFGNSAMAYSAASGSQAWAARADGNVAAVARLGDAVYFGGHFANVDGVGRKKAAAVDASSGQLLPWDPRPNSALGVRCLYADLDSLWMGGDFTAVNGASQPHLARFR
jgi:hypothetical protein